jgi:hypothetical protein
MTFLIGSDTKFSKTCAGGGDRTLIEKVSDFSCSFNRQLFSV